MAMFGDIPAIDAVIVPAVDAVIDAVIVPVVIVFIVPAVEPVGGKNPTESSSRLPEVEVGWRGGDAALGEFALVRENIRPGEDREGGAPTAREAAAMV